MLMPEFSQDVFLIRAFNSTASSCLATRPDGFEAAPVKLHMHEKVTSVSVARADSVKNDSPPHLQLLFPWAKLGLRGSYRSEKEHTVMKALLAEQESRDLSTLSFGCEV
jgi:hypothetical protein